MSDWHEIDAAWDDLGYASAMLLALGETKQWSELVREAAECTHATAEEVWDGMAAAVRHYLESLDGTRRPDGDDGQAAALRELVSALRADLDAAEREIERLRSLDASRYAHATGEYRRKVAELAAEIEKRDKGIARLKRRRGELMGQVRELADECARLRSGLDNDTLGPENVVRAEQAEANDANAAQVGRVTGSGGMGHDAGVSGYRYHIIRDGMMHMVVEGSDLKNTDAVESVEEPDTREKLEADVTTYLIDSVATWAAHRHALNEEVLRWLDRQASITEREVKLRELYKFEENHRKHIRSIEEVNRRLNDRIAELRAALEAYERDFVKPLRDRGFEHARAIGTALESAFKELERVTADRDTLQGALDIAVQNESALEAEREHWRAAYGAVMDGIFELQRFGRLMPDETVTGQGDARRTPFDG